jgi:hypothetical protein
MPQGPISQTEKKWHEAAMAKRNRSIYLGAVWEQGPKKRKQSGEVSARQPRAKSLNLEAAIFLQPEKEKEELKRRR